MKRLWLHATTWFLFLCVSVSCLAGTYQGLCYHDVRDKVMANYDPDEMAVATSELVAQFEWLKEHRYTPISIDDIIAAEAGERPLPERSVLLTFDDGLLSTYTRVFPLLKLFNYPAVIAPVVSWIESDMEGAEYGGKILCTEDFMTWEMMREMNESGLVEIASHSYNLHRGVPSNPQGNTQPAATCRAYDKITGLYETESEYQIRIHTDLKKSADLIEKHVGKRPRVMVWPYGKYNQTTIELAKSEGMDTTLVLDEPINFVGKTNLTRIGRHLMAKNPSLEDFAWSLRNAELADSFRFIRINTDDIYHPDPVVLQKNFDVLLDRVQRMKITHVFLSAYHDPDGDGVADALYFPNRYMPVRIDFYNRLSWQLITRGIVEVYATMPLNGFKLDPDTGAELASYNNKNLTPRLSLYHEPTREIIARIYEDLARYADFKGVFFDIDVDLFQNPDTSPIALDFYKNQWSVENHADRGSFETWASRKSGHINRFISQIHNRMEVFQASLHTARAIDYRLLAQPNGESIFSQSLADSRQKFNYAVITELPQTTKKRRQTRLMEDLLGVTKLYDPGLTHTVFELSATGPDQQPVDTKRLVEQMEWLILSGALRFGYKGDNPMTNHPQLNTIRMGISLQSFPYR